MSQQLPDTPTPPSISRRPLDKQAADVLRHQIIKGEFAFGERLTEARLSEQIGLSRGTIRAALNELVREGLVTQTAYTKWVVVELSADDAWELFTLRSALEGLGARLAASKGTADDMARLSLAFTRLEQAVRPEALAEADFQLHKTIIEMARHRRLFDQYRVIEQQIRALIGASNALVPTTDGVVKQHQPLVDAILARNAREAERLAREHNVEEGRILVARMRLEKMQAGKPAAIDPTVPFATWS